MNSEEKELLLIDLCARLPYGVKFLRESWNYEWDQEMSVVDTLEDIDNEGYINHTRVYKVEDIKPYLRPMSSMTEEEKLYLKLNYGFELHGDVLSNLHIIKGGGYYEREGEYVEPTEDRQYTHITIDTVSELIKWLNEHHFDYRGLIEKGLAIAVTEGNNPYKE